MDLNFEINNQILTRLDKNILVNKSVNYIFCNFEFKTEEWDDIEKFAIFKDSFGNSYIEHLGTENIFRCKVPEDALVGTHFKVTVYGGNLITSSELTVLLVPSGYTTKISPTSGVDKDVFVEIFDKLADKIDDIVYEEGCIRCYADGKIVSEILLIVDDSLSEVSRNPVQNRVVNEALEGKEDVFDFVERLDITIQNLIGRE